MATGGADPEAQLLSLGDPPQVTYPRPPPLRYQGDCLSVVDESSPVRESLRHSAPNDNLTFLETLVREQSEQMAILQNRLKEAQDNIASNSFSHSPVVNVELPSVSRLKVFTGLAPTGGNEVQFREWLDQAEQILSDDSCRDKKCKIFT